MNLFNFLSRGTTPVRTSSEQRVDRATEQARANWVSRLQTDEMRAWIGLGQEDQVSTLNGLATMLTIAGLVMASTPGASVSSVSIIRSALKVVRECVDHGAVIDEVRIVTIQVACREAKAAIKAAPRAAIHSAAIQMNAISKELP